MQLQSGKWYQVRNPLKVSEEGEPTWIEIVLSNERYAKGNDGYFYELDGKFSKYTETIYDLVKEA